MEIDIFRSSYILFTTAAAVLCIAATFAVVGNPVVASSDLDGGTDSETIDAPAIAARTASTTPEALSSPAEGTTTLAPLASFIFPEGAGQVCQSFSSATPVDFNAAHQFSGKVSNGNTDFKFKDLTVWLENKDGDPIVNGNGDSPISDLWLKSGATNFNHLTPAATANGAVTFNLSSTVDIPSGDDRDHRLGIDSFTKPSQWKVCMLASDTHVSDSTSMHFNLLERAKIDGNDPAFVVNAPFYQTREAVAFVVLNTDTSRSIEQLNLVLTSNHPGLEFAEIDPTTTSNDETILGSAVTIRANGVQAEVDQIDVAPGASMKLWIRLNEVYSKSTTITVTGVFD